MQFQFVNILCDIKLANPETIDLLRWIHSTSDVGQTTNNNKHDMHNTKRRIQILRASIESPTKTFWNIEILKL